MELRKPTISDEKILMDYIKEHYDNGEMSISASNMLPLMKYNEWIEKLKRDEVGTDLEWGMSETYILVDNDRVLGILNIRYNPSDEIVQKYGHIGYGVRPSERRKGIATYLLKEALIKCIEKGLTEVTLGCYKDNLGSSKTIIKNNGILYKRMMMEEQKAEYYKIKL